MSLRDKRSRREQRTLDREQTHLDIDPSGVVPNGAIGRYNPMAGQNDGHGIPPKRVANRPRRTGVRDFSRDLRIGGYSPEGNCRRRLQHVSGERGESGKIDRHIETFRLP